MMYILRSRINLGTWAVFIVLVILILQNFLSQDVSISRLPIYGGLHLSDPAKNEIWGGQQIDCVSPDSDLLVLGLEESSMESRGDKQYCLDS